MPSGEPLVPLTRREDVLRDQLARPPYGTRVYAPDAPPVRVGATGSGDDLLVLTWSAADLARERAAGARLFAALGVRPGMRVANTLPGALATPGSLLLGDVVEEIGALDVPLGEVEGEAAARAAWELFDRVEANVLVLDAAASGPLLAAAPPAPRRWWQGVVWLRTAAAPRLARVPGFPGWQRIWLAVPEATSFVAHTCAAGRYHVEAHVVAEVVDGTTGAPRPAGREGMLALTPSEGARAAARYASGLRARALESCACGETGAVLEVP
jgi:hypothetical protein